MSETIKSYTPDITYLAHDLKVLFEKHGDKFSVDEFCKFIVCCGVQIRYNHGDLEKMNMNKVDRVINGHLLDYLENKEIEKL
jgi:hypothetical protein